MEEYVFIPDHRSSGEQLVATLQAVVAIDTELDFLAAPAGGAWGALPVAVRPMAEEVMTRGLEILEVVPQSGVALVRTSIAGPAPAAVGGTFHPVVNYTMAVADVRVGRLRLTGSLGPSGAEFFSIALQSAGTNKPIGNAIATLGLKNGSQQLTAVSDSAGIVRFGLRAKAVMDAMLAIEPGFAGHWGYLQRKADLVAGSVIMLDPIDLAGSADSLRHLLPPGPAGSGRGVVVGVVDSGVGPHNHLTNVEGDDDSSIGHGTHVAGIIAGNGGNGYAGVAPGASIRSYRVFDDPATGIARNFEIHRAIEQAVDDGCHIINLSLKAEREASPSHDDRVLSQAIEDAAEQGVLVVAAAGNDFRRFVAFPARHRDAIAVSALGWEPGLPANAYDRWTVSSDRGDPDRDVFFATFSNEGHAPTRIDLIGPGAGVVSTVPGDQYAPMSGTSMACPAMTGAIARILSADPGVLTMPPNRARYQAMRQLAFASLRKHGFGAIREGGGMII
ncbi:S8 family peptidase [Aminobacter niigataensis]|uniref:S8 family peptidase n=1 Tax=Aminobacter niigataensis TaxID=83265 RepID=UPI0024CB7C4F|nr:S8 family serine peptidase [Aminobacter niigataensis]CAI2935805.1 Subtilisin BL [Aminobacter niigataensis]